MDPTILVSITGAIATITVSVLLYRKDIKVKLMELESTKQKEAAKHQTIKINALDKLLDFTSFNIIRNSVDRIFENTKADHFLILIAVNGKTDFNVVSVIFEQHKSSKWKVNAIVRYRDVNIDDKFRQLLKDVEYQGTMDVAVDKMENQIFKDFHIIEKLKHIKFKFLHRENIDDDNDVIIYSTVSTHLSTPFTKIENAVIKTEYEGSIIHTIKNYV
jgi:hypothetical protein